MVNNFSKIDLDSGSKANYKAIGFAYSIPCGDGDYEAEVDSFYKKYSDEIKKVEKDLISLAHNGCRCNHCGKKVKYLIVVRNMDTKSIHIVGSDCGITISSFGMARNRLDKKSARAMKVARGKIYRKKILTEYKGLSEAFEVKNNKIISEIKDYFFKYSKISEKQIGLVLKLAERQRAINLISPPIDYEKTINMECEVLSVKNHETIFGEVKKILLKNSLNQKLYGNLTSSSDNVEIGDKVKITTNTIKLSDKDTSFAFFSKATIVKS